MEPHRGASSVVKKALTRVQISYLATFTVYSVDFCLTGNEYRHVLILAVKIMKKLYQSILQQTVVL